LLNSYVLNTLAALLAALVAAWHILSLFWRLWNGPEAAVPTSVPSAPEHLFALHLLLLVAGAFALAGVLQFSLVTLATLRYADAAGVFLPAVLVPAGFMLWGKVRPLLPAFGKGPAEEPAVRTPAA